MIPGSGVTGIVVYGAGRHFSSGADLDDLIQAVRSVDDTDLASRDADWPGLFNDNLRAFSFFELLDVPVIAAIRGVCLGSGLELALFCHARVCGRGSVLGLPEAGFGLIPGCGGIQKLNALAGRSKALELSLTGSSFTAEEALAWKIVDRVVPKKDVVDTAIMMIREIQSRRNV